MDTLSLYLLGTFVTITGATTGTSLYLLFRVKHLEKQLSKIQEKFRNMRREKTLTSNIDTKILELWSRGYSLRQIAREVGVSHSTVYRRLKKILEKMEPPTMDKKEELGAEA